MINFDKVMIVLKVDSEQCLFIRLAANGTVNRSGTGALDNDEQELYVGNSDEDLFTKFRLQVNYDIFDHQGIYDIPDKVGKLCSLTLNFSAANNSENAGFKFLYGSDSKGPPGEIRRLVDFAIKLTNPWYSKQKQKK